MCVTIMLLISHPQVIAGITRRRVGGIHNWSLPVLDPISRTAEGVKVLHLMCYHFNSPVFVPSLCPALDMYERGGSFPIIMTVSATSKRYLIKAARLVEVPPP
jgi:hypothetical protein